MKQRLVGAVVLLILAAIFLPHLLKGPDIYNEDSYEIRIPPRPDEQLADFTPVEGDFSLSVPSQVIPKVLSVPVAERVSSEPLAEPLDSPHFVENNDNEVPPSDPVVGTSNSNKTEEALDNLSDVPIQRTNVDAKVSVMNEEKALSRKEIAAKSAKPTPAWVVQVASFSNEKNALRLRDELRRASYACFVEELQGKRGPIFRVRVGPELDKEEAQLVLGKIEKLTGLKALVMGYP